MAFNSTVAAKQALWNLPEEPLHDLTLQYNAASRSVVLSCALRRGRIRFPQVFFRKAAEERYSSVAELAHGSCEWEGDIAVQDAFSCETPKLVCLATRYDLTWADKAAPIASLGLLAVDLEKRSCELWDTRDGVVVDWILQSVVGCSGDGTEIFGVVGFPSATESGYRVEYCIARLLWKSRTVEKLHVLPAVHY